MKPIAGYDANGNLISGDELENRRKKITGEIMQVLERHDLTIGQAVSLLDECGSGLICKAQQTSLTEARQHLKRVQPTAI